MNVCGLLECIVDFVVFEWEYLVVFDDGID